MAKELRFQSSSLPFDELIKHLNGVYYLDTFEVGSIKIEDVPWPTVSRNSSKCSNAIADLQQIPDRPRIDTDMFEDKNCKLPKKKEMRSLGVKKRPGACSYRNQVGCQVKFIKDDESEVRRVVEETSRSDLPLHHSSTDQDNTSFFYCRGFLKSSLPFDEVIRYLNGGYYLDTFEVGTVKIEDVPWPSEPKSKNKDSSALTDIVQQILERPLIDSDKFDDKKFKIPEKKKKKFLGVMKQPGALTSKNQVGCHKNFIKDDESGVRRALEKISGCDRPLNHSCTFQEKTSTKKSASILSTIIRKKDGIDSSRVIKSVSVSSTTHIKNSSVLGCPTNKDDEEKKLDCSRRKMKKQYDEIESEKKRRRKIQVIEHQKDLVTDQPQVGQRAKKGLLPRTQLIKRKSQFFDRRMKLDSKMFV